MTAVQKVDGGIDALNSLIMAGDMSKLNQKEKLDYYHGICKSIGLNPLTKPFDYMKLNGKEVLYATKGAAEQLRNIKGISVISQNIEWTEDLVVVTVEGRDRDGRVDTETGFAYILEPEEIRTGWDRQANRPIMGKNPKAGQPLAGEAKGNVLLKAITKAKRRLTLSMAGLGMLDETEVESIPTAQKIDITDSIEVIKKKPISKEFAYSEPFQIKVVLRGTKPDWAKWFRDYSAHLQVAPDDRFNDWLELNKDAYANSEVESPENFKKLSAFIDERVQRLHDKSALYDEEIA